MLTQPRPLPMALLRPTLAVRDFLEKVLGGEFVVKVKTVRMDSGKAQTLSALVSDIPLHIKCLYTCRPGIEKLLYFNICSVERSSLNNYSLPMRSLF